MKVFPCLIAFLFPVLAFCQSKRNIVNGAKDTAHTYKIPDLDIDMIFVQGGSFRLVFSKENVLKRTPAYNISLNSYYISKCEITQAQWKAVMGYNDSYFQGCDKCPVENITWYDTQDFLDKLSKLTGATYRLPTDAEWQYAAIGGAKSAHYKYSGSNLPGEVAWYYPENGAGQTHPVGTKKPNELGLYDMSGNVSEWCSDWYDKDYFTHCPANNPQGPATGDTKVLHGGCYSCPIEDVEAPDGLDLNAGLGFRYRSFGFRIVRNYP